MLSSLLASRCKSPSASRVNRVHDVSSPFFRSGMIIGHNSLVTMVKDANVASPGKST